MMRSPPTLILIDCSNERDEARAREEVRRQLRAALDGDDNAIPSWAWALGFLAAALLVLAMIGGVAP